MKNKPAFYQKDDQFLFATGESPKGMVGVLAVVWQGTLDNLTETIIPIDELQTYRPVEPDRIPLHWWNAFADASGVIERKEPEPEPEPEPLRFHIPNQERSELVDEIIERLAAGQTLPKSRRRKPTSTPKSQVQKIEVPVVNVLTLYTIWFWGLIIAMILASLLKAVGLLT